MKKVEKTKKKSNVQYVTVQDDEERRLDNFLLSFFKNVPKSHIYKMIRKGEVRVNRGRVNAFYRLNRGDVVRLPPIFIEESAKQAPPAKETLAFLQNRILYEDENIIVINKPAGMSVHGGSTVRIGIIEALRHLYPKWPHLELAHRLDSETSGCLILAKKKKILRELHTLLREGKIIKMYWALTKGRWKQDELRVDLPLHKDYRDGGKHVVYVHQSGKSALTEFKPIKLLKDASLVEVKLFTGRTHQIRVHAQHQKHPIACDDRYGDPEFNKMARTLGLKRMFLHARSIDFVLPSNSQHIKVIAPLDNDLEEGLKFFSLNE